jgi:hypothetical protein
MNDSPLADRPVGPAFPEDADEATLALMRGIDPDAASAWPDKPTAGKKAEKGHAAVPAAKNPALILTLGGAPLGPHRIEGLPGFYRPDVPTPCDGPGEPSLAQAQLVAADAGCAVALIYLTDAQVKAAREQRAEDIAVATGAFLEARDHVEADTGEVEHLADELNAIQGS